MRANVGILFFICWLVLVGTAAGHLPDASTITNSTSDGWIIANGVDQVTITVMVMNSSLGSMPGANVVFSIDNPIYGTMTPVTSISDATGKATSAFKVNTKSGTAIITASITSHDGYVVTRTVNLNLDHDTAYHPYFFYPLKGEVASEIPFTISLTDRWGNRIDNRRGDHIISLHVHGPAPDDCTFVGYGHDISPVLDPNGNLSVAVKLSSKIGSNYILMDQFGSIPDQFEWIVTEATGIPHSMTGTISDGGILPVGTKPFIIDYFLYDEYGNPVKNRSIWVNTTLPGEQELYTSNSLGQIRLSYGPKITVNDIT
ncbi:MAG: Ig-like domain-containing protein, partial [Methanoregula sp.]|nr:Ig-like domain-containing protein [Methanoregula sp.]